MTDARTSKSKTERIGIRKHFEQIHAEYKSDYPSFIEFAERFLLFISVSYWPRSVAVYGNLNNHKANPLKEFGKFYFWLNRKIFGKKLGRKRQWQPFTPAWVDFDGSRSRDPIDLRTGENPHVHALMLVRPPHLDAVRKALFEEFDFMSDTISSIDVKQFDHSIKPLNQLIGYAEKGFQSSDVVTHVKKGSLWLPSTVGEHDFLSEVFPILTKQPKKSSSSIRRVRT